jgi:hypothetical protein
MNGGCTVTKEQLGDIFLNHNKCCHICTNVIDLTAVYKPKGSDENIVGLSWDQVRPGHGYSVENVKPSHVYCNFIKSDKTDMAIFGRVIDITNRMVCGDYPIRNPFTKKEPAKTIGLYRYCVKCKADTKRSKSKSKRCLDCLKYYGILVKSAGVPGHITRSEWLGLQKVAICALCGNGFNDKMCDIRYNSNERSIDRIDPTGHYTLDNIQVTHYGCNRIKWTLSNEEMLSLLQWIAVGVSK